jgi:hypothetical protein
LFEYDGPDFDIGPLSGGSHPHFVFSVTGDQVHVSLTFLNHHAWVADNDNVVTCWADMSTTWVGQATLARDMVFDLTLASNGPPTLTGPACAEFPYTWEQEQYEEGEIVPLPVHLDTDGALSGGIESDGVTYFGFG